MYTFLIEKERATFYKRYKSAEPLEAKDYIGLAFLKKEESENLKKTLPLIPASGGGVNFCWVVPDEIWVRKELGMKEKEASQDVSIHYENFRCIPEKLFFSLRSWQKRILHDACKDLSEKKKFRKGLIVGLGGGKTLTALLLCQLDIDNAIYICPNHLKDTVALEAEKWDLSCPAISTPESAKKYLEFGHFKIVILDECLSCKEPSRLRSSSVTELAQKADIVLCMTGTPLSAKHGADARWLRVAAPCVPELENNMKWLFGINPRYEEIQGVDTGTRFDGTKKNPLVVDGYDTKALAKYVSEYLYVIDIADIMREIPPLTKQRIYLEKPKFFQSILQGLLTNRSKKKSVTQAKCATSGFIYDDSENVHWLGKATPAKISWVKDFINDNPNEPVVLFSYWDAERERLLEELKEYKPCTEADVKPFLDGSTNILICASSSSEGLNLQRARIQIFLSNATNPVKRTQAEGRLYRQGQTKSVVIYDLICKDTLDEKSLELLEKHKEASEDFIENLLADELERLQKERL